MNYKKLGVIGGGNMAQAIVRGAVNKSVWPDEVCMSNPHLEKLVQIRNLGVKVTKDNREAAAFGDVILFAVKPQMLESVIDEIEDVIDGKTVISIAAGYSKAWLRKRLPNCPVICVMPNLPITLGKGASAITPMEEVPENAYKFAYSLFYAAGGVFVVPADKMNDIIPINGSSPAFFFDIIDIMANIAVKSGFPYDMAVMMAAQTMSGAADLILKGGKSPAQLTREVCSPGGTTLAALTAFDEFNIEGIFYEAFMRCINRANELGK